KRAMRRYAQSLKDYESVKDIYDNVLEENDYLYAALYNNLSLLYQETGQDEESASYLKKALSVLSFNDDRRIEQAITRTNLAQAYIRLNRLDEAKAELISAEDIFEKEGGDDFHYPGCLNAMGDIKVKKGDLAGAVPYYEKALKIIKIYLDENSPGYVTVSENLNDVRRMMEEKGMDTGIAGRDITGMELARSFYEKYGKAMIHDNFAGYEDRITAGLVGRGSQCYGFDDALSRDHDFGPDFCIWLDDDLYDEIGAGLQEAYDKLPEEYMGYKRVTEVPPDGRRVGVLRTKGFYAGILGINEGFLDAYMDAAGEDEDLKFFSAVEEADLSQCTNGEIFKPGTGDFARIRERLAYYPERIWRKRIAEELHYSAQMGQYNYIRMLKRGEKVGSEIALAGYMEHTMKLVYLLNRRYAPYYKWLHRGMQDLEKAAVIMDIFNAVYDMPKGDERIRLTTEIVAAIIIEELNKLNLAQGIPPEEKYLDVYSRMIGG
nr:DUF4037 domain-containing protein [Lachnospiraceae bacterium]